MRCERLRFDAGGDEICLDLHPRLTVLGGMDPEAATILVDDLVAGLVVPRPGARVELVSDRGDPVTSLGDLLPQPPDPATIDALVRIRPIPRPDRDGWVGLLARLSAVDPGELQATAGAVIASRLRLEELRAAQDAFLADCDSIAALGARHGALEDERHTTDRRRRVGIAAALVVSVGAAIAVALVNPLAALAPLLVTATVLVMTVRAHRRGAATAAAEQRAIEAAGADTALGIQLRRVSVMLQAARHQRDIAQAEEDVRDAAAAWGAIAGPLDPARIGEHTAELNLLRSVRTSGAGDVATVGGTLLALLDRIERSVAGPAVDGPIGAHHLLPAVLEGALDDLPPTAAIAFLEHLLRRPSGNQVILVTWSDALLGWARGLDEPQARVIGPRPAMV